MVEQADNLLQVEEVVEAVVLVEQVKLVRHRAVMAEQAHLFYKQVLLDVMVNQGRLVVLDILPVVAVVDLKQIVDTMEKVVLVEAETQDQDQEQVQEMDRLELLILVVELVAHPEVLQEQILLKKVIMVVKE